MSATVQAATWGDTFYQYRVPVTVDVQQPGLQEISLPPDAIVSAINVNEELKYDARWFAFNQIKVVTQGGQAVDAGFTLIESGNNLLTAAQQNEDKPVVSVEPGAMYVLRYTAWDAGQSPIAHLEPVFPPLHRLRKHSAFISYLPHFERLEETTREVLIVPSDATLQISLRTPYVSKFKDVSLRRVDIRCLADLKQTGQQKWWVYYQPTTGHYLSVPDRRSETLPPLHSVAHIAGSAEKYTGRTSHAIASHHLFDAWFAETTVKLTPSTPVAKGDMQPVRISAAANESQSFQLVLRPKRAFSFESIYASDLVCGDTRIAGNAVEILRINYVPITVPSYLTPVQYRGPLADPLVAFEASEVNPIEGNVALWVTVRIAPGTAAGVYEGALSLACGDGGEVKLPLSVEVFDFALPEFSPFRSSMGGAHITKVVGESKSIADYHRVSSRDDLRKMVRNYFDVMARNKFTPHSIAQFSKIGMNWSPPPKGYNVDEPGNYFQLHDWDFTELNMDLEHYIDDLKVNAFTLIHTNPSVVTMFKHLPGKPLDEYNRHPPHVSLDWQQWREMTQVGYDKREKDNYIEITRDQYDRLIMDFYRKIAENLEAHGWLDYAYILMDETAYRGYEPLLHFMKLLKSDPLTARIKVAWNIQHLTAFNHKVNATDEAYAFNNLLDIYVPEVNENRNLWEDFYFSDYEIEAQREKLWTYVTYTSRVAIDTPGVNNRAIALEVFKRGGGGFLTWGSFVWDSQSHQESNHSNPWEQPWTRWGNGAMAYFYPPHKAGVSPEQDFTVIPSLRVMTYRESVDDYEYAWLLEQLIAKAEAAGLDVSSERGVLAKLDRFFISPVHWSQNDAWYLDLRDEIARAVVALSHRVR